LLNQFAFVGALLIVALILGVAPLALVLLFGSKRPRSRKAETDESDLLTRVETWIQFKVQYYVFALAFVVFDVGAAFLLPWALAYQELGTYAAIEAIIFILVLLGGLVYVWRKGALEWM
jgi:NADH-quinone oxidoreductase subunit A